MRTTLSYPDAVEYGVFDVFPDNMARLSHLGGAVPRELAKHAMSLLGGVPDLDMLQVLATHFAATALTAA